VVKGVETLLENSLIYSVETIVVPRFRMHETIREYAQDRLKELGDEHAVGQAHALYFAALLSSANHSLAAREPSEGWFDRLQLEHDNFRLALGWSVCEQRAETAVDLGHGLWAFWASRGYYAEGRDWLKRILALPGAQQPDVKRGRILAGAGLLALQESDYDGAQPLLVDGMEVARTVGDSITVARALNNLAALATIRGDFAVARELGSEGLTIAVAQHEHGREALLLDTLATVAYAECLFSEARSLAGRSLRVSDEVGYAAHRGRALAILGQIAYAEQEYERAERCFEQSLRLWHGHGSRTMIARVTAERGRVEVRKGDARGARSSFVAAIRELEDVGEILSIVRCLEHVAELEVQQGRPSVALQLVGAARRRRHEFGAPLWPVELGPVTGVEQLARTMLGGSELAVIQSGRPLSLSEAVVLATTAAE
jgi:non-specific serine/threonine protein kinase